MSIAVPGNTSNGSSPSLKGIRLHQLPCWINYNGPAKVDQFFFIHGRYRPQVNADGPTEIVTPKHSPSAYPVSDTVYTSSFRGRLLQARRCTVPKGYRGYVLTRRSTHRSAPLHSKQSGKQPEGERQVLMAVERFGGFMVWDHDRPPQPTADPMLRAMDWLAVASLIHSPMTPPSQEPEHSDVL
ncbi:hypothetical protein IWQ62_005112 [Dispira parvispora]|uniref:Uncharacterized protein n=1 Tax=Dispira parvispora TaxID=1520584 RepID=A0A9W8AR18_9FUNG|nr:hypothetical protein IWQ62_005112 [Dispira parvispora]